MDQRDDPAPASVPPGLCGWCVHARRITSERGSLFYRCGRSDTDARFPKYPPLPVLACIGYEAGAATPQSNRPGTSPAEGAVSAERATLALARTRAGADLACASAPAHRTMLEHAIAELDRRIAALARTP